MGLDNNLTNHDKIERSVMKLVDAVPLSAKDRESQDYKKENDGTEKPSEDNQDSKQEVIWFKTLAFTAFLFG